MKTVLSLLVIPCFLACAQSSSGINKESKPLTKEQEDSSKYITESLKFIKSVIPGFLDSSQYLLQDEPASLNVIDCFNEFKADTSTFSKEDLKVIQQAYERPLIKRWTPEMFPRTSFVKKTTIDSIFEKGDGWEYFYNHIGAGFNTFSAPIFLRDYSWCLIYTSDHCGWLCASGRLELYSKKAGKWEVVKSWCNWIS